MVENIQISHAEEFQINYTETPSSWGRVYNSPLLMCGLHILTSFQRSLYNGGKEATL